MGEFIAFTIGWNLILEYVIGASSVARGLSTYIDALVDYKMKDFWREIVPVNVSFLAEYPDILSFAIVMVLSIILAMGVKESSWVHSFFTTINLATIFVIIIAGSFLIDPKNLNIKKEDIPADVKHAGNGGFAPYGFAGIISGAATTFYGFIGFDCVASAGEEAKNAKRTIPLAIILTLGICVGVYVIISIILTMMMPYYLLDPDAPFTSAFQTHGYEKIKWIISIGAAFALFSSLLGALFSLPRILYAMSSDGVLFRALSKVNPKTRTPMNATLIAGFLSAILAAIFSLQQLVDMLSIGTLLAYSIVGLCVLILRYENVNESDECENARQFLRNIFKLKKLSKSPTRMSSNFCKICSFLFLICAIIFSFLVSFFEFTFAIITLTSLFALLMAIFVFLIHTQPTDEKTKLSFKVPCLPLLPCVSILINIYLMMQLDIHTWIRFVVWMIIGYLIYFLYGMRKSSQRREINICEEKSCT